MSVFNIFRNDKRFKKQLSAQEESALMMKIKNADSVQSVENDFNQLYSSLVNKLWGKLLNKFHSQLDFDELQDAFQEGWRKVLENRKGFIEGNNVYNWIYTIIKNTAFDMTRKDKKILNEFEISNKLFVYRKNEDNEDENMIDMIGSEEKSVVEEIEEREIIKIINDAIESIEDETDKKLLKMRIIENKNFSVISKEINVPIATIHYRVNQTLKKLKNKLEKFIEI